MIIKGNWKVEPAFFGGYLVINSSTKKIRIGQIKPDPHGLHYGSLSKSEAEEICVLHNTFRGYDVEDIKSKGIMTIVGNELLKQDEIIKNLLNLVEHYGKCYNHNVEDYDEYCVAKKYMENK